MVGVTITGRRDICTGLLVQEKKPVERNAVISKAQESHSDDE